jgi:putative endonuclease
MHCAWIYIMTNAGNTTLYIGVTTRIYVRINEHKMSLHPNSFTARYKLFKLVYYEGFSLIVDAIAREKFLKGKSRKYKEDLINKMNPQWRDLEDEARRL